MSKFVTMPRLIQDQHHLRQQDWNNPQLGIPYNWVTIPYVEDFSDGPATSRVAVKDFDAHGNLKPGAKFLPQGRGKLWSCYDVYLPNVFKDGDVAIMKAFESDAFIQVSTFATVMETIHFFESLDALGRRITWGFKNSPQLLIYTRAGLRKNACYSRTSCSLKFFYYPSSAGHMIYTALSHDIVAHETAHAVLDGIAPDLNDASRTQSIAFHEAIADLAAIVLFLLNEVVILSLFDIRRDRPDVTDSLAKLAEEFGSDIQRDAGLDFIRTLKNRFTLDSVNLVDIYEVGLVLSGAIYQVFIKYAKELILKDLGKELRLLDLANKPIIIDLPPDKKLNRKKIITDDDRMLHKIEKKQTRRAARVITRMVFRALDYLPPGEISLADFARAMIAAHRAIYGGIRLEERLLVNELVNRKVVNDKRDLEFDSAIVGIKLKDVNTQELLESNKAAERFAERYRKTLNIPNHVNFTVQKRRLRIRVRKRSRKEKPKQDLVFRVSWEVQEKHDLGPRFASQWEYTVGTTLVMDWDTGKVLSVLTTDQGESQYSDRDRTLRYWTKKGWLLTSQEALSLDKSHRNNKIIAKRIGNKMRVTGSARVLCS